MGSAVWSRSALCNFYAFAFSSFLILSSHLLCRSSLKARLNYAWPSALKCINPQCGNVLEFLSVFISPIRVIRVLVPRYLLRPLRHLCALCG